MFFSGKIPGIRRIDNHLYLRIEYGYNRFHVNEISCITISDRHGSPLQPEDLPARFAQIQFTLKNGRRKKAWTKRLTRRRLKWLLSISEPVKKPTNTGGKAWI